MVISFFFHVALLLVYYLNNQVDVSLFYGYFSARHLKVKSPRQFHLMQHLADTAVLGDRPR